MFKANQPDFFYHNEALDWHANRASFYSRKKNPLYGYIQSRVLKTPEPAGSIWNLLIVK